MGPTSTTSQFSVTSAVNQVPVLVNALAGQLADQGAPFTYTVPANAFTDPEGQTLTYTATKSDGTALPSWLSFNAATRTFSGTPPIGGVSWSLRVRATDPQGLFAVADFALEVLESGGGGGEEEQFAVFEMEPGSQTEVLASTAVPVQVKDQWFTYDAENRMKVVNGMLSGAAGAANTSITLRTESLEDTAPGQIEVSDSYALMYDAAGRVVGRHQRRTVSGATQDQVALNSYDQRGNRLYEFYAQAVGGDSKGIAKQYQYDAAGQLLETRRYFALGTIKEVWVAPVDRPPGYVAEQVDASGWLMYSEQLRYDQDGRMRWQETRGRETNFRYYLGAGSGSNQYTDLGLLHFQSRVDYTLADNTTDVDDNLSSYDAAGRMEKYRYSSTGLGATNGYTHTFTTTFEGWESWQERIVAGESTVVEYRATTNTITLDAFGRINQQSEHTTTTQPGVFDKIRAYTYNGDGQVQTRRDGYWDGYFRQATKPDSQGNPIPQNYQNVYAAGQQIVELEAGGAARVAFPTTRHGVMVATAFGLGQTNTLSKTNGIAGSGLYAAGGMSVTVMEGETLHRLAQRVYGTASLWYVLADANGMSDASATLTAGTQLKAPSVSVNSNDANTFKPYNPNEAIGSTTPSLPYIPTPPKADCNVVAMILIVIIVVVVSVLTWGALTGPAMALGSAIGTSAVAAGAIAGAAGALAGQVVGSLSGVSSFSWRNVAAGAITGALTAGIASQWGSVGGAIKEAGTATSGMIGGFAKAAALAVGNAGAGYVGQKLAGLKPSFSWKSIAASALTSVVSAGISKAAGLAPVEPFKGAGNFGADLANGAIEGVVGLHTRRAFGFDDKVDYGSIAANAFGTAAGNALARGIQFASEVRLLTPDQRKRYGDMVKNGIPKTDAVKYAQQESTSLPSYLLRPDQDLDKLIAELREKAAAEGLSQEKLDSLPKTVAELREEITQEAFTDKADRMQSEAVASRFGFAATSGDDGWIKPVGVNGMRNGAPFFSWSNDPSKGWGLRPTDKEISDLRNMGWKDRLSFYGGMFIGLFGNVGTDVITSAKAAYEVNQFISEGTRELLTVRFLEKADMTSNDFYFKTRDSLDQKFETLTNIAINAPRMIEELPAAMLEDIQSDFRSYTGYIRDRDYYNAGIAGMQLTYKTLGLVIGGVGVAKVGATGVRSGVSSLKELASAAKNIGRREVMEVRRKALLEQSLDSEAGFPGSMLRKVVPGKFEAQINAALSSKNKGDNLEGRLGSALDKEGLLLDFQSKYRNRIDRNGRPIGLTEIDAETPKYIIEATEKKYLDKINQLKTLTSSPLVNPEHKPVLLVAPNAGTRQQVKLLNSMGIRHFKSIDELITYIKHN